MFSKRPNTWAAAHHRRRIRRLGVVLALLTASGCTWLKRPAPPADQPPVEESELHALAIAPSVDYAHTLELGDNHRVYYSDRDVLYTDGEQFYPVVVQGYPHLVGASPERDAVALLEPAEFEMAADLFVFDIRALTLRRLTDHRDPASTLTVKTARWHDGQTIYYLEGYRFGTLSRGGDLWCVDLASLTRRPIAQVMGKGSEFEEIVEFEFVPGAKLIRYVVARYNEFGNPIRQSHYCTLEGKPVE